MTREIILSDEMKQLWSSMEPPLNPEAIVKLAIGKAKAPDLNFNDWEIILSEIITGDAFGVDRMDYLLRDSYHTGVGYGRFDHHRLIDTLVILHQPQTEEEEQSREPVLGVEEGGLHAAEALPLARYFMYSQVYFHHIRRIYDIHLRDFLVNWRVGTKFPINVGEYLKITDNEVLSGMNESSIDSSKPGHLHSKRITERKHFKCLYMRNPEDFKKNTEAAITIFKAASKKYGDENLRFDAYHAKDPSPDFPVLASDGRILSAYSVSQVLDKVPKVVTDYIFIAPELRDQARIWLDANRQTILSSKITTEETS
jgi:uncharacterized protein